MAGGWRQNPQTAGIHGLYTGTFCGTAGYNSQVLLGYCVKGMSVPPLCKISKILRLTTDYILFGTMEHSSNDALLLLLQGCSESERGYAEQLLKTFLMAMTEKGDSL